MDARAMGATREQEPEHVEEWSYGTENENQNCRHHACGGTLIGCQAPRAEVSQSSQQPRAGASGILGTLGSRFGGWALMVVDGKPEFAFAYSNQPTHKYTIASPQPLSPGKHTIEFDFRYDGGGAGKGGTGTLSVDGKQVAQGRVEKTIRARFSLDETMDFGEDTGTPVLEDYAAKMPFKFTGTLDKFVIHLGETRLSSADQRERDAGAKRAAEARQ